MAAHHASRVRQILTLALMVLALLNLSSIATTHLLPVAAQSSTSGKVRAVDFCKMLRQPYRFLDQPIRITARWEPSREYFVLRDARCQSEFPIEAVVVFADNQNEAIRKNVSAIQSPEFGGRALITAVGVLWDPARGEGAFRFQFKILRFENVEPMASPQSRAAQSKLENIPTIDFCELARHPGLYFNKTVRIEAMWLMGFEFSYLTDDRCPLKFTHDIAVRYVNDEARADARELTSHEYGGRAIIRVVGVLRNPGRYYGYFRYLFEINRIEDVAHVVVPYQGMLEPGKTYRAVVRGDGDLGLILVPALRLRLHEAVSIDWTNLNEFPALEKLRDNSQQQQIVFSVISDKRMQMSEQRWNRALECKIIRIE